MLLVEQIEFVQEACAGYGFSENLFNLSELQFILLQHSLS